MMENANTSFTGFPTSLAELISAQQRARATQK
jgi:hypothetical protein